MMPSPWGLHPKRHRLLGPFLPQCQMTHNRENKMKLVDLSEKAWSDLHARLLRALRSVLFHVDHEDLCQQAYLILWQNKDFTFDTMRGLYALCFTICKRRGYNLSRDRLCFMENIPETSYEPRMEVLMDLKRNPISNTLYYRVQGYTLQEVSLMEGRALSVVHKAVQKELAIIQSQHDR